MTNNNYEIVRSKSGEPLRQETQITYDPVMVGLGNLTIKWNKWGIKNNKKLLGLDSIN